MGGREGGRDTQRKSEGGRLACMVGVWLAGHTWQAEEVHKQVKQLKYAMWHNAV